MKEHTKVFELDSNSKEERYIWLQFPDSKNIFVVTINIDSIKLIQISFVSVESNLLYLSKHVLQLKQKMCSCHQPKFVNSTKIITTSELCNKIYCV